MNKRGASHADWAISLGIFLLYILSMLMIIQPGVEPFYREDQLLKIATENFKENTAYSFYKTPLIIDTNGMQLTVPADYLVQLNVQLPFSGENVNNYAITNGDLDILKKFNIEEGWSSVSFNAVIESNQVYTFYMISNKKADGSSDEYIGPGIREPPSGTIISDTALPTANFTLTIGSTEALYGVSQALLAQEVSLPDSKGVSCQTGTAEEQEDKYNDLKTIWKYPRSKDFVAYYVDGSSPQYEITDLHDICVAAEPYEQANVFVEEWATRMFTTANGKTGEANPIRMGVKVW
ncbi:MAG: hypothetical protein V1734_06040 [Nanoarchaeota archaeon]